MAVSVKRPRPPHGLHELSTVIVNLRVDGVTEGHLLYLCLLLSVSMDARAQEFV